MEACGSEAALIAAATPPAALPANSAIDIPAKAESPVKPFGQFMKVKGDGEHCRGYDVELWTQDEKMYGVMSVHRGLCGDPPAGRLENVQFDPRTKKLSFKAKVSISLDYNDVPSHDVLEFDGFLTPQRLYGTLTTTDQLCPDICKETKTIDLPRSQERSPWLETYESYQALEAHIDKIMKFRGPRW